MHPLTGRGRAAIGIVLAVALSLCGCSFNSAPETQTEGQSIRFEFNNFPVIDPHTVTYGEWLSGAALYEGMVKLNPDGTGVEPAAASTWDVSKDQKTYTFHLRDAKWSDGSAVTAQDFLWSYQRLLTPSTTTSGATQGANSFNAEMGISGATDFQLGAIKDFGQVGIKAPDDKTVVITLSAPNSDFLLNMTHPSMVALPAKVLQQYPKEWQQPEHFVGNGAYVIKSWTLNSSMELIKNPNYWNAANVDIDRIALALTDDVSQSGLHFQNNETDIAALLSPDVARFQKDPELGGQLLKISGFYRSYLAVLHSKNPALEDVRVRQALSLAMGRENLAKACTGCEPAYSLVPADLPGAAAATVTEDVAKAKDLLAQAGYPGGKGLPPIRIITTRADPTAEATVDNWRTNLGIEAALDVVESGVYVQRRAALQDDSYIGFYGGAFSSLPSWRSWTSSLWGPKFTESFSLNGADWDTYQKTITAGQATEAEQFLAAKASPEARAFAAAVREANGLTDPKAAEAEHAEAAKIRQDTYLFLPTLTSDAYYAVRSGITGLGSHTGYLLPFYLGDLKKA